METIERWFTTESFAQPAPGFFGNAGRNLVRGPNLRRWDFSLMKNFGVPQFGEASRFQVRLEAFNFLNRANFANVSTNLGAGNFGQVTSARAARTLQLGLKLEF